MSYFPKGKYSGIDELNRCMHKYVDSTDVTKDVSLNLVDARHNLKDVKGEYLEILYLFTVLKDVLLEHNYGLPDPQFEAQKEDNIYMVISNLLSSVEAKHCLNISLKPKVLGNEENLFGLSIDDFEVDMSRKKLLHQNIQQVLIPQVEKRLKSLCLHLYKFLNQNNEDSEGLALAKANKFPLFIISEKEKLQEAKIKLKNEEVKYEDLFEEYFSKISRSVNELQDNYSNKNEMYYMEANKITIDWLAAKCDFILSKMKVMRNRLYFETYTKETTEALQKVRCHLTKEINETRTEIQKIQQSLKVYESVGDAFTELLNEYTRLTIQIDNKKWALTELKNSKLE